MLLSVAIKFAIDSLLWYLSPPPFSLSLSCSLSPPALLELLVLLLLTLDAAPT